MCTLNNLKIIPIPADDSLGPNWARRVLQDRYDGEEFTLLLDSHHRFVTGWDQTAREMLEGLRKTCAKPILTAYLPPYDPKPDPRGPRRGDLKFYPLPG